ncbi:MAG: hypothetical protein E6G46_11135 [Actinobacteria bacterium]|nr:MAG: hypothetical protein E6G46_11135 [Actinomycetota bacterium]
MRVQVHDREDDGAFLRVEVVEIRQSSGDGYLLQRSRDLGRRLPTGLLQLELRTDRAERLDGDAPANDGSGDLLERHGSPFCGVLRSG